MGMRFSRTTLNYIVIGCLVIIAWISLQEARSRNAPEILDLPPLSTLNIQQWESREGVSVQWQIKADDDLRIRLTGNITDQTRETLTPAHGFFISKDRWQWDFHATAPFDTGKILKDLKLQLNALPDSVQQSGATITLQGPLPNEIMQLTAARIIRDLKLQPLINVRDTSLHPWSCPWIPVTAVNWVRDHLPDSALMYPDSSQQHWLITQAPQDRILSLPDNPELNRWKKNFAEHWQEKRNTPASQFDFLADLAYYRLPPDYPDQGYMGLNDLTTAVIEQYLKQCQPVQSGETVSSDK